MTTSSTSSLLPANSPTTNLPLATTTNLPSATSTTTNLPPATSTTSHLLLETSTTSHLPSATSSTSHLLPSISTARACNINEADLFVVPVVGEENLLIEAEIEELDDVTMNEDVEANVNLEPGGFEVKKSAQKKTKSGLVKSKYVMCNRKRVPKEININTLDPQNSDKQIKNTRYRITGCMARIKVDLDHVSGKVENLAADHLSRLENPYQDELEKKEITKTFLSRLL
nr:hypothetical protein [Tanacetum cinerariifolium]